MSNITLFNFNGSEVHTIEHDNGSVWFFAKESCDCLGIENVGNALYRLKGSEKDSIRITDVNRGTPTRAVISESGLYKLVLLSRKPEAEAFQDWVTAVSLLNS